MAKRGGGGRHCERERSNPRFAFHRHEDCFVAALLAMTSNLFARSRPLHHAAHGPRPPRRCARGGGRNSGSAPRERPMLSGGELILPRAVKRSGVGGVIASVAKQSSVRPAGICRLLRRCAPRNDIQFICSLTPPPPC